MKRSTFIKTLIGSPFAILGVLKAKEKPEMFKKPPKFAAGEFIRSDGPTKFEFTNPPYEIEMHMTIRGEDLIYTINRNKLTKT